MSTKVLRRLRYATTGELRKRETHALDATRYLREQQTPDQLLAQVDKLLTETNVLSARFTAISDMSVAVNSSLRPDDILEVIVVKSRRALDFDYCALGTLNEDGGTYTLRPLVWPEGDIPSAGTQTFDVIDGLPGSVASSGKPLMVQNLTERPLKVRPARFLGMLHPDLEGRLAAAGLRSLMVLPLIASGRTLGCLSFAKKETNYYNHDDMQLAYFFSMMLATALHNSRLFNAETRRSHQLQMLTEIGQTATSILDPSTLLARIPPMIQRNFGYGVAKIGLLEDDEVVYASAAQFIAGSPRPPDMRIRVSRNGMPVGIVGLAAYTGQMVLVPNVFEDDRWSDVADSLSGPHISSVLVIPMAARDRVLGVLHFESERTDAFSAADVTILQSLANQLGVALDNARLYQQLNDLFHRYIAPQVASTLLDNPMNAQLGGQKRQITVLFADLENFTGLSERVPPEELLELLNACRTSPTTPGARPGRP
jgi:phosphoserine phosphatase RsbU/P